MKKHAFPPALVHSPPARMFTLAASHFTVDMLGCTLPGILPAVLLHFNMNLGLGVIMVSAMAIGSNLLQIPASMLGKHTRSPRFLVLAILLASCILILPFLPASTNLFELCLLMFTVGAGIALAHPMGLRGTQNLFMLPVKITMPVYMTLGFFGSTVGPWLAALLVQHYGMRGMLWLLIPVVLTLIAIFAVHIRLKREPDVKETEAKKVSLLEVDPSAPWSFEMLMLIALFVNTGTTTINSLLPTMLNHHGFELWFGGFSNMLYGFGSAVGSIVIGIICRKHSPAKLIGISLLAGIPVGAVYIFLARLSMWACLLAPIAGVMLCSCFPILVSLTTTAPGRVQSCSTRLGLIVGATWGLAGILLLGIGQLAAINIDRVMYLALFFYFCAFLAAVIGLNRSKKQKKVLKTT